MDIDANIVLQALELALEASSESSKSTQRTMTSIKLALCALYTKLLQRIWAGEYINFSELPPAKSNTRSLPHYLLGQFLLLQMQELESNSKRQFETSQYRDSASSRISQKGPGPDGPFIYDSKQCLICQGSHSKSKC